MKILLLVLFLNCWSHQEPVIETIRESFKHASTSETKADIFFDQTEKALKYNEQPIFKAYHGAALVMRAAHCSIFYKMSNFKKGKTLIEKAIDEDPSNIEIRMIRLGIQYNIPKILAYYKNIEEDKKWLLDTIEQVSDASQKDYISGFMRASGIFE